MAKETTLKIPAIHCSGCVGTVTRALKALPGVDVIRADPASKVVRVHFEESTVSLGQILEALDGIGFSAED